MDRRHLIALVLAAACTPMEGEPALVLIDAEAREAGVEVWIDEAPIEGVLPERVELDEEVWIDAGDGPRELWTEPGVLHHVQGPSGRVEAWFVGVDVGAEQVVLDATEEAADELAAAADADLEETRDGWLLTGAELWELLADADLPDGLFETVPVSDMDLPGVLRADAPLAARRGAGAAGALAWLQAEPTPDQAARDASARARQVNAAYDLGSPDWVVAPSAARRALPQLVGRYCAPEGVWTLDALGSASRDEVPRGTWGLDDGGRIVVSDGTALRILRDGIQDEGGSMYADGVKGGCDDDAP